MVEGGGEGGASGEHARAHDARRLALCDAVLEARHVRVNEVLLRNKHVNVLAVGVIPMLEFVRNKVLAARGRLQGVRHLARVLKALDKVDRVLAGSKGVLASALDVPPPAGVPTVLVRVQVELGIGC